MPQLWAAYPFMTEISCPGSRAIEVRLNKQGATHAVAPARQACICSHIFRLAAGAVLTPSACGWWRMQQEGTNVRFQSAVVKVAGEIPVDKAIQLYTHLAMVGSRL